MTGSYVDIIELPRPVSVKHPRMPTANRAAQFIPFAALTGYDAAIFETARLTDRRIELDEYAIADLDAKLQILQCKLADHPEVTITHFREDIKKAGGAYVVTTGLLKKIDDFCCTLVFANGDSIALADILDIHCALFERFV